LVRFGGNTFSDFSAPPVFEGRYFIMEPGTPNPLVTVVVEHDGEPVFEVLKNEPQQNPFTEVSRTPVGIVTVRDRETEAFLYKVQPRSETSVTFGRLDGSEGESLSVRITDRMIEVLNPDGSTMLTAQNNRFDGTMAGFLVASDGSVDIGVQMPPKVRSWLRGA
jgi:hypothetical protein